MTNTPNKEHNTFDKGDVRMGIVGGGSIGFSTGILLSFAVWLATAHNRPDVGVHFVTPYPLDPDINFAAAEVSRDLGLLSKSALTKACTTSIESWFSGGPPVVQLEVPFGPEAQRELLKRHPPAPVGLGFM